MITLIEDHKCFEGKQQVYEHFSEATQCFMRFGVYLPPNAAHQKVPVLYYLSGLTCTEQNFITKASAQRVAAALGIAIISPDTSPRNVPILSDPNDDSIGLGAGYYLNATTEPWAKHFQMYDYVVEELPVLIEKHFPIKANKIGIFGHSMGGHGALCIAIKNPNRYKSLSAFAPICAPIQTAGGQRILSTYLGNDKSLWVDNDASCLIEKYGWPHHDILIDQGTCDSFAENLRSDLFAEACRRAKVELILRMQEGYDHGYYFVATFIEQHLKYHAQFLL